MLSPRYLDGLSDEIVEIYAQFEADILQDMARRIARLGKITEQSKWQAQLLAEAGALKKNVQRYIKKYDPAVQKEITAIYNDALIKNARADNRIFSEALGHGVSDINAQVMLASIKKTHSDLSRLTITTAYTTEQQFVQQANNAYMQTVTGAFDYDTVTINACKNLARDGVHFVQYLNGKPVRRSIEAAVRMNILTGVNQTASAVTMANCEELGCDLVETTAHIGARPTHEEWQGQIFSLSGTHPKYRPFSVCGLGEADGICGINCRHSYYPYFEGLEKHYTQNDLDEMGKQTVVYNDEELTRYDAEQKLRGMERNIRKYKREALTLEAAGKDSTAARVKIGEWQAAARDFTKQTKLERDRVREFIGTADGKQPRGIFYNTNKEILSNANNNTLESPILEKELYFISKPKKTTEIVKDNQLDNLVIKAKTLEDTQKLGYIIQNRVKENKSTIFEEISKVREMGVNDTMLKMARGSDAGTMQTISKSLDYFPKTAGESILNFFENHNTKALFNKRGKLEGTSAIFLDGNEITGVHELAHVLEKINPWLADLEKEFYNKRTAGEDFLYLKDILPFYRDDEKYKKDNFLHPYIGKYNDGKEWEILSTGLQHIMFNIFNGHDKDYEAFIIGLLLRL